jgi:hypothetical protein
MYGVKNIILPMQSSIEPRMTWSVNYNDEVKIEVHIRIGVATSPTFSTSVLGPHSLLFNRHQEPFPRQ